MMTSSLTPARAAPTTALLWRLSQRIPKLLHPSPTRLTSSDPSFRISIRTPYDRSPSRRRPAPGPGVGGPGQMVAGDGDELGVSEAVVEGSHLLDMMAALRQARAPVPRGVALHPDRDLASALPRPEAGGGVLVRVELGT